MSDASAARPPGIAVSGGRAWLAVALAAAVSLACEGLQDRLIERAVARAQAVDRSEWLDDGALHVVLCGTGSPLADPSRAGPCTAVVAGGALWIVDIGPGATERLLLDRMPLSGLAGVLLTHFHSDHIGELGELTLQSWAGGGRREPLPVHGPPGVARVVDGFVAAYAQDSAYRVAHHGADVMPPAGSEMRARPFDPPADGTPVIVLERDGLRVTAARVDHAPVTPAVAYRFDYAGRSVVISGDTVSSPALVRFAQGADLLVHEVLADGVLRVASRVAAEGGRPRLSKIATDVIDYHTSPGEAVEVAREAGVGTVVFSHLVPPLPGLLAERVFERGVVDDGRMDIVLGEDGMHFTLPAGSAETLLESL